MANPTPEHANLFHLDGDGLHVTFSATSITGDPLFTYQDAFRHLEFKGDQIKIEQTAIGELVSVVILPSIDRDRTTFTLVVPNTVLRLHGPAAIATIGVTTVHRFSIIGSPNGQTEFYTPHALRGTAEFVVS